MLTFDTLDAMLDYFEAHEDECDMWVTETRAYLMARELLALRAEVKEWRENECALVEWAVDYDEWWQLEDDIRPLIEQHSALVEKYSATHGKA